MTYKNILLEQTPSVATITVNRPDKLNALNATTIKELDHAFQGLAENPKVKVIVLTGAGDKAFVAGADISEINQLSASQALAFSQQGQRLMLKIEQLGKPVIAAVNGYALGGGCELAMACTLRIAADNAKLGLPEISLGIMPGFGGTQRLNRLAGRAATLEMSLSGKPIDAERAYTLGLVTQVVPSKGLTESVASLATSLCDAAPIAVSNILKAVEQGNECSLERGLEYESQLFALCCASEDMKEGTAAFLSKRKANFKGQ